MGVTPTLMIDGGRRVVLEVVVHLQAPPRAVVCWQL